MGNWELKVDSIRMPHLLPNLCVCVCVYANAIYQKSSSFSSTSQTSFLFVLFEWVFNSVLMYP